MGTRKKSDARRNFSRIAKQYWEMGLTVRKIGDGAISYFFSKFKPFFGGDYAILVLLSILSRKIFSSRNFRRRKTVILVLFYSRERN